MIGTRAPLKYSYEVSDERCGVGSKLELLSVSQYRGVVPRSSITDKEARADDLSLYKVVRSGQVVINRMSAYQGALGIARQDGIVSPEYIVLRPTHVEPAFLTYMMKSTWFVSEMIKRLRGIGSAEGGASVRTPRINPEDLGGIECLLPAIEEQRAIADYLDAETARIDALIAKKKQLIQLLEDRFESWAEMTLFGGGAFTRLDRIVDPKRKIMYGIVLPGPDVEGGVNIVKGGNVRDHRIGGQVSRTTQEIASGYGRSALRTGDLVIIIRGAGAGRVAHVEAENDGWNITQDVARVAPCDETDASWLRLILEARPTQLQLSLKVGGATITGINIWDLKRLEVPDVSLGEQRSVAHAVLDRETTKTSVCATLQWQIELLAERRQALVTAAVTGEFKVPGAS